MNLKYFLLLLFMMISFQDAFAQVFNEGVAGNTSIDLEKRIETDVLNRGAHLVIVMVGTNDMLNSKKMLDYSAYEKHLKSIVGTIKNEGADVLLVSPPTVDSVYLFQRHDRERYEQTPNQKLNAVAKIMEHLTIEEEIDFLDLHSIFKQMRLPVHNRDVFIQNISNSGRKDGVHPTSLGYRFIATVIYQYIKANYKKIDKMKIICFGDSITYGSGAENPGDSIGESYPAILSQLLAKPSKN
ncbi:SGNH/GDSL hydrolase family protein [Maribacter sp. Hel_I_7]|uniref:SGNH/GDSL hydrolase family protein n=1 Tax=Maribacter sp. Hel_I_7 TaxID=1249997 RepID=UPI000479238C|nr:SGNH/GDSL hydrolase family protein [Maribacter sp. Hel_I_7]